MMAEFLEVFGAEHPTYKSHKLGWKRDERRHFGQDPVLEELPQWKGEEAQPYQDRKDRASYLNFGQQHAAKVTGHLARKAPPMNYGDVGEVRTRDQIDTPTLAELFDYNCDGIGNDGLQFRTWVDGVEERACATGFRWVLVEMPTLEALQGLRVAAGRAPGGPTVSLQDQIDGFHPYLVEYSPLDVTNWRISNGVLQWAVIRISVDPASETVTPSTEKGYYVLVRQGYQGLGPAYGVGGWWIFDGERKPKGDARWTDTRGQIPLMRLVAEPSKGTYERPAMARSLTMELGQLSVGLMNLRSARDFNLIQAGKSINYGLGIDEATHAIVVKQLGEGSIFVSIPPVMMSDGRAGIPSIWNSSEAAIATGAFKEVVDGTIAEAREIMVKQVTSTPDASGASKEAGFAEATSPLLARLASTRESFENTVIYFVALRFGKSPNGSVTWPREFPIRDLILDIDAMLDSLRRSAISSSTWEKSLLLRKGDQLGVMPDNTAQRKLIEGELQDSIQAREDRKTQAAAAFAGVGADVAAA